MSLLIQDLFGSFGAGAFGVARHMRWMAGQDLPYGLSGVVDTVFKERYGK
jgi:hypothetical protein